MGVNWSFVRIWLQSAVRFAGISGLRSLLRVVKEESLRVQRGRERRFDCPRSRLTDALSGRRPKILVPLEVEADLRGQGSGRDVVRAAKSGEEVVHRVFIADVDGGQAQAPLVTVAAEKIVVADSQVEEVAGSDTRRIVVIVLGSRSGDLQEL
jgi:hypothetical protein